MGEGVNMNKLVNCDYTTGFGRPKREMKPAEEKGGIFDELGEKERERDWPCLPNTQFRSLFTPPPPPSRVEMSVRV